MRAGTLTEAAGKAETLIEALPYIRTYSGSRVVVKIGGEALDDVDQSRAVAADITLLTLVGIDVAVVHGGGPQITRALHDAGLESHFVGGLRVTDEDSMAVVAQVLTGSITPGLVGRLNEAGARAVGLSGLDGGLLTATRLAGPHGEDLGRVGAIASVDDGILERLMRDGFTPVVASVAPDESGHLMNINADEAAGAVAIALQASKLVYLTNVEGLYRDLGDQGSLISELSLEELADMVDGLTEGMRPKVGSAVRALREGVGKVHILDGRVPHALLLEIFTDEGIGTQVVR